MNKLCLNTMIAALLLFILSCTSQKSDQLTQLQIDQIKGEVKVVWDSLGAKCDKLDSNAIQYYLPEAVILRNGSLIDYQEYKKLWMDLNNFATGKWINVRSESIVLTKDLVIVAWIGKIELLAKSGDKITMDPQTYTDVFKKIGGQWKVIYEHSSSIPVIQPA